MDFGRDHGLGNPGVYVPGRAISPTARIVAMERCTPTRGTGKDIARRRVWRSGAMARPRLGIDTPYDGTFSNRRVAFGASRCSLAIAQFDGALDVRI